MRSIFPGVSPPPIPLVLKGLLIVNIGVFVLDYYTSGSVFSKWLGLDTFQVFSTFQFWRLGTYMFIHSLSSIFHIMFNMLMLWMFGVSVISVMGEKKFLYFYLAAGLFAGICSLLFDYISGQHHFYVGASGAVFGICIACARYFPNSQWLIFFLFPVRAKWAVTIFMGIDLLLITSSDGIAHITHLGGALFALVYFRYEASILSVLGKAGRMKENLDMRQQEKEQKKARMRNASVDMILKKISDTGIESLTSSERKLLDSISRQKRAERSKIIDLKDYQRRR